MTVMGNFNYGDVELSKSAAKGLNRTVLGSDFEYRNAEFTSQAIGNRQKRHQKMTPIMKWEFHKDTLNLMSKIRAMKPVVDSGAPRRQNAAQTRRYREEHEQIRLYGIEKENHEMLDRLRRIHNRPRSAFCHLKRRGDPLIKGDAFRLPPPSGKGNYLVEMYKKLKLANPISARKSIRVQQEMLTSAIDLVKTSNKVQPSEEMIETEVQSTLSKKDVVLPEPEPEPEHLSPVEVVQLLTPEIDAQVLDELVAAIVPAPAPESSAGASETSADSPQSAQGVVTGETSPGGTTQSMDLSGTVSGQENNAPAAVPPNLVESQPFG